MRDTSLLVLLSPPSRCVPTLFGCPLRSWASASSSFSGWIMLNRFLWSPSGAYTLITPFRVTIFTAPMITNSGCPLWSPTLEVHSHHYFIYPGRDFLHYGLLLPHGSRQMVVYHSAQHLGCFHWCCNVFTPVGLRVALTHAASGKKLGSCDLVLVIPSMPKAH